MLRNLKERESNIKIKFFENKCKANHIKSIKKSSECRLFSLRVVPIEADASRLKAQRMPFSLETVVFKNSAKDREQRIGCIGW